VVDDTVVVGDGDEVGAAAAGDCLEAESRSTVRIGEGAIGAAAEGGSEGSGVTTDISWMSSRSSRRAGTWRGVATFGGVRPTDVLVACSAADVVLAGLGTPIRVALLRRVRGGVSRRGWDCAVAGASDGLAGAASGEGFGGRAAIVPAAGEGFGGRAAVVASRGFVAPDWVALRCGVAGLAAVGCAAVGTASGSCLV
jgi:hypothetical protein